jgi:hypothetical protein
MLSRKQIILLVVLLLVVVVAVVLLTLYFTIWRNSSSSYVPPVPAHLGPVPAHLGPVPTHLGPVPAHLGPIPATIVINPNAKTCAQVKKNRDILNLDPNYADAVQMIDDIMTQNNCSSDLTRKVIVPTCSVLQANLQNALNNNDPYKANNIQIAMGAIGCGAPLPPP